MSLRIEVVEFNQELINYKETFIIRLIILFLFTVAIILIGVDWNG